MFITMLILPTINRPCDKSAPRKITFACCNDIKENW